MCQALGRFFFDILQIEINQTSSHSTHLPVKKNQSLKYALDCDRHHDLFKELLIYTMKYPFIQTDDFIQKTGRQALEMLYGFKKPISFMIVLDDKFLDLHYNYSEDGKYTFICFNYNGKSFDLPIEIIHDEPISEE